MIDKIYNKSERVKIGDKTKTGIDYQKFGIKSVDNKWNLYEVNNNNIYYSLKETTNEKDLKLLSKKYEWTISNMKKVYLYVKN